MADIFPTGYFAASRFLKGLPPAEAASTICAVIGCGPVGICAIASALTVCSTVYAIDGVPERIAEAEKIGAKPLLLSDDVDAAIKAATEGRGADVVLDVVGHTSAMELALKLVRPFGKTNSIGMYSDDLVLSGPVLYGKNVTCAWGRCPVRSLFEEALECLFRVQGSVGCLCERSMGLEDAQEAFRLFDARKVHKVVLVP
jgi:threonine dehydrogenase-like Zn-dependent dehydrogenase